VGRSGWVHDYNFIAQWFPKIAVYWKGAWNAHQFHATTEFFSDYGVYDVAITLPRRFVVGASGREVNRTDNADGTATHKYHGEDIHDFAWTASPDFVTVTRRFEHPTLPAVDMRLLIQPEHVSQADRYLGKSGPCSTIATEPGLAAACAPTKNSPTLFVQTHELCQPTGV